MFFLTQREQLVILTLLGIFLVGLGVRQWRSVAALHLGSPSSLSQKTG
jgi:hypothetical protein